MKRSTKVVLLPTRIIQPGKLEKWLRVTLAVVVICTMAVFGFVDQASAGGATQISGIGYPSSPTDCDDAVTGPDGQSPDIYTRLHGDLEGCQYAFIETHNCTPSGIYTETGSEIYVLDGPYGQGTFETTYRFQGKFEGCSEDGFPTGAELFGGCQHPIIAGTGTGDYEGVTGRLRFKDDVVAGNFPYHGQLKW